MFYLNNMMKILIDVFFLQMDTLFKLLILIGALCCMNLFLMGCCLVLFYIILNVVGFLSAHNMDKSRVSVGIFHPYSQAGGGGERVLWYAVKALQTGYPMVDCVIYTGDSECTPASLDQHLNDRFNIGLPRPVTFIHLSTRNLLEARLYPRFTMVLQALGSIVVGIEAISKYKPDVFIDTMGYSFTFPIVKMMARCKIACYIHYPIISMDMIDVVQQQTVAHNNMGAIANSQSLSYLKSLYYRMFSKIYGYVGQKADVILVNSTWTKGHIDIIWRSPEKTSLVFPPCDVVKFSSLEIIPFEQKLVKKVLSIGQFRPEKNHELQLCSFKKLLELVSEKGGNIDSLEIQLVVVGGARNVDDRKRVSDLQDLAKKLNIECQVDFKVNVPFNDLLVLMQESCIGLHTMWNEHFGIGLVEMQAAGLVTVGHDSGGPKLDIIVPHDDSSTGLLASDVDSYADSMFTALTMSDEDRENMLKAARGSVKRFSDSQFRQKFVAAIDPLIQRTLL